MEGLFRGNHSLAGVRVPFDREMWERRHRRRMTPPLSHRVPPGAQRGPPHIPTREEARAAVEAMRRRHDTLGLREQAREGLKQAIETRRRMEAEAGPQAGSARSSLADVGGSQLFDLVDDAGLQSLARSATGPLRDKILRELARRAGQPMGTQ